MKPPRPVFQFVHQGAVTTSWLVCTWLILFGAASGQSTDVMDLSLEQLKHVQVYSASMHLQSDREAPSAVTVITAEQVRLFGYRTLGDALRSVRGFDITYDRNYTSIGLRGFSRPGGYNDQVLLLINGNRLNDNVYNSAQLGSEFPLDMDIVERIEIVRGPGSALYGTSALLAVINVITKKAGAVDGLEMSGQTGGFTTYRARSTFGKSFGGVEALFSGTFDHSDGASRLFFPAFNTPDSNNGVAVNADRDSSRRFFASFSYRNFTLSALGSRREKGIPTASYDQVFNDNRSQTIDSTGFVNLEHKRTIPHDAELTTNIYFDRTLYHGVYVYPPVEGSGNSFVEDAANGDCFGANVRLAKTFWQRHKAAIGVDFRDNLAQVQTTHQVDPFETILDDHRSSLEWALHVQDEFTIAKGLILNAGLRHDQYQTFGGTTNPRLALIYTLRPKTTLKLLYGQAFRDPSNYELYYTDGVSQEPNPYLLPEKIRTEEMIWEQDLGTSFRFTLAGFANQFTDLISQQTDAQNSLIVFKNVQGVHSQGVEMELSAKTRSGTEGRVSYTLQNVHPSITFGLTGAPSQLVKANLSVPVARRQLWLGLEVQSTSTRTTLEGTKVGGHAVSNFSISTREFAGGFRISGSAYNIFNIPYHDPVGTEVRGSVVRQNGRDFRIQLLHRFSFR